jgi:putative transposase
MAWETQTEMTQRTKMILEYSEGGYKVAALARRYGVSRKTANKWIERFKQEQWAGLENRSRAPHHQPYALSEEVEARILALKKQWPLWGAPKLHHKLRCIVGEDKCPCESTVSNVLRRHGLSKVAKPRRIRATVAPTSYGLTPNQTWCADFKGWWRTLDGQRCDPLTITDASSRYLIRCQVLSGSTARHMVQPVFIAAFREYGLPEAIRTDNGAPFASGGLCGLSKLSVWWLKQGIRLDLIEPGHPEQNGRHERMHRTLKEAVGKPARHLRAQQAVLDEFRRQYNEERPHEALDFAVPATRYEPSTRAWSEKLPGPMEYDAQWQTRAVKASGQVKWKGQDLRITDALVGERVGFKPVGDGRWDVYFGTMCLGHFDERKYRLQALRRRPATTTPGEGGIFGSLSSPPSLRSAPSSSSQK